MKRARIILFLVAFWVSCFCDGKLELRRSTRQGVLEPAKQCFFDNVNYTVGEYWYPFLSPQGYFRCIRCSCKLRPDGLTAMVECKSECKKLACKNAYLPPGECCRRCPGSLPNSGQFSHEPKKGCMFKNSPRKHGQVWAIGPEEPNLLRADQCTECSCTNGFVSCATRTCPRLPCNVTMPNNRSCCPICAGVPEKLREPSGCQIMGRHYRHMESWHPRLPPTHDLCKSCTCRNTSIQCKKLVCPNITCSAPVRKPGDCCLTCPVHKPSKITDIINTRRNNGGPCEWGKRTFPHNSTFNPTIGPFGVEFCVKCVCNASKLACERIKCPANYPCKNPVKVPGKCCKVCKGNNSETRTNILAPPPSGRRPCSSGKYWQVYVNERINKTQQSEKLNPNSWIWRQFALEDKGRKYVEIHSIQANMTTKIIRTSNTTSSDFKSFRERMKQQNNIYRFKLVGQIREGRRVKISEKERGPCHHTRGCIHSVVNLMKILRMRGRQCRAVVSHPPESLRMLRNQES